MIFLNQMHKSWPLAVCVLLLAGCSGGDRATQPGYQGDLPPLEVPPGLSLPQEGEAMVVPTIESATLSGQQDQASESGLLPKSTNVKLVRHGEVRWLSVENAPESVWSGVRDFLTKNGFELKYEDPKAGLLETDWVDSRANAPQGTVRSIISRAFPKLYSSPYRDRYRFRLERDEQPGVTAIYVSHYGLEQVERGDVDLEWVSRPSDPELVNEMLARLMVHLGVPKEQAGAQVATGQSEPARAVMEGNLLVIREPFPRAWRLVGIAIDRIGLIVEDRDRSDGTYFVRAVDLQPEDTGEEGFFSGLFSDDKKVNDNSLYRIVLGQRGAETQLRIDDDAGAPTQTEAARVILKSLHEQLR